MPRCSTGPRPPRPRATSCCRAHVFCRRIRNASLGHRVVSARSVHVWRHVARPVPLASGPRRKPIGRLREPPESAILRVLLAANNQVKLIVLHHGSMGRLGGLPGLESRALHTGGQRSGHDGRGRRLPGPLAGRRSARGAEFRHAAVRGRPRRPHAQAQPCVRARGVRARGDRRGHRRRGRASAQGRRFRLGHARRSPPVSQHRRDAAEVLMHGAQLFGRPAQSRPRNATGP